MINCNLTVSGLLGTGSAILSVPVGSNYDGDSTHATYPGIGSAEVDKASMTVGANHYAAPLIRLGEGSTIGACVLKIPQPVTSVRQLGSVEGFSLAGQVVRR